jgi:hypothetical protein
MKASPALSADYANRGLKLNHVLRVILWRQCHTERLRRPALRGAPRRQARGYPLFYVGRPLALESSGLGIASAVVPIMNTTLTLKDRVSGNRMYLSLRDGVVVGAMGADPKRYLGLTEQAAKHKARYAQK